MGETSIAAMLKRFFGFFGLQEEEETTSKKKATNKVPDSAGFRVKVAVPADTNTSTIIHTTPVVARCYGNGGVQGLTWYAENLRADDDGDVAQEFLKEVIHETEGGGKDKPMPPRFEAVTHTRPVRLKGPVCIQDGNVHQSVELSDKPS